jgi:FtsP/CotA-like multicopper oxidase with cupredoxin domain
MADRRYFLQNVLSAGAGLFTARATAQRAQTSPAAATQVDMQGGYQGNSSGSLSKGETRSVLAFNTPVITTDVGDLPFEMDGEIKVFRLTAHVFKREIAPDKTIDVWGFNGSSPGPTMQVRQGDKVRVVFTNRLPEPSSIHWHGFEDRVADDGMPGISQELIRPGQTFTYNFSIKQEGTYFYHSHMAMQELAGMLGAVIMHPKVPYRPHCDKDFLIHLQEYAVLPNSTIPNTMMMEFNWLLLNGKAGPASTPLIVRQGDRVRIRFVNLGMDHHPMHLHGHTFYTTGTEGGRIPETAWWPGNTVLVGVAQARDIEFIADNPGDWMLHCHLPHHMMNQMASQAGPITRMAAVSGGAHPLGPVSQSGAAPLAQNTGDLHHALTSQMNGMQMEPSIASNTGSAPTLGEQTGPASDPLADAKLDASMMGLMNEQMNGGLKLSQLQRRNLDAFDMSSGSMKAQQTETSAKANDVPNFPQDAYMEGPMMNMDSLVSKPENLGLRADWSRFMQGMMTFVRVLPPEQYDQVLTSMREANRPGDPYASLYIANKSGA